MNNELINDSLMNMKWDELLNKEFPYNSNYFLDLDNNIIGNKVIASKNSSRKYSTVWLPSDTYTQYKEALKDPNKEIFYNKNDVTYDVNQDYFRCDDIREISTKKQPVLLSFGCSMTFGIGLPESETWPVILGNIIKEKTGEDVKVVNFGSSASGYGHVDRLSNYMHLFNVKYISCLFPPLFRKTLIRDDGTIETVLPAAMKSDYNTSKKINILSNLISHSSKTFNYEREMVNKKLESISKLLNVPYSSILNSEEHIDSMFDSSEILLEHGKQHGINRLTRNARDGMHPGNEFTLNVAYKMSKVLFNE